jgi:hypothetical protein
MATEPANATPALAPVRTMDGAAEEVDGMQSLPEFY